MKRSLSLISAFVFCAVVCCAQDSRTIPKIEKPATGKSSASAVHTSAAAKKSRSKRTVKKAPVHMEIKHTAPDQRRIDSLKAVQMKGKK